MTEQQVLDTIDEIRPNILKLVYTFFPKMKQPSIHRPEDLEQEGVHAALQQIALDRFREGKGATIQTYLIQSVMTRFIDLMRQSYRAEFISSWEYFPEKPGNNTGEMDLFLEIMDNFTPVEKRYTTAMLSPPAKIQKQISRNRKVTRRLIREVLNITREEEYLIRKSIKEKLTGGRE